MKTGNLLELIKRPAGIFAGWTIMWIAFCFIGIPILTINSSGGEQKPLIYLSESIYVVLYGYLFISIFTSICFFSWFKKYWYVNALVFLVTSFILFSEHLFKEEYRESYYKKKYVGNDEIEVSIEKYTADDRVRSERFWRNNKRDSIWTIYDKKGIIIEQKLFRNDSLIRVIK
jgi:hypothetical protein